MNFPFPSSLLGGCILIGRIYMYKVTSWKRAAEIVDKGGGVDQI